MCAVRTVAGVVLLRDDNAALLQLRDNKPGLNAAGLWVFPGGHCEPGESLEAYIARRRGDPDFRPWIFYQFSPLQGTLEIIDYAAILDISKERRRIAGIELVLTGRREFVLIIFVTSSGNNRRLQKQTLASLP